MLDVKESRAAEHARSGQREEGAMWSPEGKTLGTYAKDEIEIDVLQNLMAGGKELQTLSSELGGTI